MSPFLGTYTYSLLSSHPWPTKKQAEKNKLFHVLLNEGEKNVGGSWREDRYPNCHNVLLNRFPLQLMRRLTAAVATPLIVQRATVFEFPTPH